MVGKIVRRNLHTQSPPIMDQQCKLIPTTFQSKPSIIGTFFGGDRFIVLYCFEARVSNHFTRRPALCVRYVNYAA